MPDRPKAERGGPTITAPISRCSSFRIRTIFARQIPGEESPPAGIIYRRVTPEFFVVSSIRNDRIWYNRCNRSNGAMNCVMINYPAAEKRRWDGVVTRISQTLRG